MSLVPWPSALLPAPSINLSGSVEPSNLDTPMESGLVRHRRRFSTEYRLLPVEWQFDDNQFAFFQGFHLNKISSGADQFTIDLPMGAGMRNFTAALSNKGKYSFVYVPVLNWTVKATLEIQLADVITASEYDALVSAGSLATITSYLT